MGFPADSDGKEFAYTAGNLGLIPGLGRAPGGGHGNPLQYSCLENPQGQRSLVGYSPWVHKKSDMTKKLTYSLYFSTHRSSDLSLTQDRTTVFDQDNYLHVKSCSK